MNPGGAEARASSSKVCDSTLEEVVGAALRRPQWGGIPALLSGARGFRLRLGGRERPE